MKKPSELNLEAVSKEDLLRALIYMASEYITTDEDITVLDHLYMSAGETACKVLLQVGAIEAFPSGGKWLIDPWVYPGDPL